MIRKLKKEDLDRVMQIWLDTNIEAHSFISEKYWRDNFNTVKIMLPQSELYIYENECNYEIEGFIGVNNDYIAGLFVCPEVQSKGIGKQLLEYIKNIKNLLTLSVYKRNERAVNFYIKEKFEIQSECIDENTEETEYIMVWEQ
ncbi:MAG: N-acetyltransferase [Lachnospiraceae bacterium]